MQVTPLHFAFVLILTLLAGGCQAPPRNMAAVRGYYSYDFAGSREALRPSVNGPPNEQTLLDLLRYGQAGLADGDLDEAERGLRPAFDLLSTSGLNADRTTAAVLVREDVRIWKGEPFEQALAYVDVGLMYAVQGDWENARAAIANASFRLRDFGDYRDREALARAATQDDDLLDSGYVATDASFVLGLLLQGIASDASGLGGSAALYDAAVAADPELEPLVNVLRTRDFDTLLVVAWGKGPTKLAYGPDRALARFEPQESGHAPLNVTIDGEPAARTAPVCRTDTMATDLRWNNLEETRIAKSVLGQLLQVGGAVVASGAFEGDRHNAHADYGHDDNDAGRFLVGAGLWLAGLLARQGAEADTRYLETVPHAIYLAPLRLERPGTIVVERDGARVPLVLPDVAPGTSKRPRAIYLRLHGPDSPSPPWLTTAGVRYGNDVTGVRPGDYPWILGGNDCSTPSRAVLEAYQASGYLTNLTLTGLRELYAAEGIQLGAPPIGGAPDEHRHILEGGRRLFTPAADSVGYKRLMGAPRPAYQPRSELVRNVAAGRVPDGVAAISGDY